MTEGEMGVGGGAHWDKFLSLIKFPPSQPPLLHLHTRFNAGQWPRQEVTAEAAKRQESCVISRLYLFVIILCSR